VSLSDNEVKVLLNRIAAKDEKAFVELHRQYARSIFAFALNRLHDRDEAETVVSDTLYEIWRQPLRFRGESRFSTWLLGIARYKILDRLRGREEEYDELDDEMPSGDLGAFDILAAKQRQAGVRRCMERLEDVQRESLQLVFYEGFSLGEVAEVQQCPENTVKTRLFHARKKIKSCLERMLETEAR
jgi:RNA polymerase sigma-70 factor (ECF subfamily)